MNIEKCYPKLLIVNDVSNNLKKSCADKSSCHDGTTRLGSQLLQPMVRGQGDMPIQIVR